MAYIKIPDPNIVDLTTIHNIINTVNLHSDSLNTLTNNFGANANSAGTGTWTASDNQHQFDMGSQMIVYGRASFTSSTASQPTTQPIVANSSSNPAGYLYYKNVTFAGTTGLPAFVTAAPLVFLTIHTGNSTTVSNYFVDAVARVYSPSTSGFNIALFMKEPIGSSTIYVNWMAVGPKNK